MKIVVIEPQKEPEIMEIEGELTEMQEIVGGSIETMPLEEVPELLVICNEEGRLLGLDANFENFNQIIVGTAFVCGVDGEELIGLTEKQAEMVVDLFGIGE